MASSTPIPYTGPPVSTMLATHTLAENIIKYHSHATSSEILDAEEIALLRRFVEHPEDKEEILRDERMDGTGEGNRFKGSLVGWIVARHGGDDGGLLSEEEIALLKGWLEEGGGI